MTLAKCFPRLNGLDFSYTHRITDEQFSDFLKLFPEKQLKKVNLDNVNWLEDTSISFLCNKHASTLTHLNIDGENNTDDVFGPISRCYNLTSIVVNFSQGLTDAALDALSEKQIFTEICFRKGSNFTEEGLNQLLLTLDLSNLNVLNLSECSNLTNSGALLIAAHCKNLTNLSLCWCWEIDDVGILPIVTECSKMVEMDLTGMHKLTGHSFLVIPVKMPKLTLLKLEMCNDVDDEVLHMVVIQMKGKLEIINYYYETIVYDPNADDNERVLLF
ncbi:uncharacterized protein LOC142346599 [Convolutriloba macropyga]|uniref:uncharacterized protein LOC142346599 n=1 Tax=Convolutriloba macropyga TaxID=536237 RepID=UPI003F51AD71